MQCNATEHVAKSGQIGQGQPKDITVDAQANNPNFEQNLADEDFYVISKVSKSHPLFGKCRLTAAMFQKLTTRALSGKKYESGNKKSSHKAVFVFLISFVKKLD